MNQRLKNNSILKKQIIRKLNNIDETTLFFSDTTNNPVQPSSVLLALSNHKPENGCLFKPHIILTKRSQNVPQPGDLCCPGGKVAFPLDQYLSKIVNLPFLPLSRWPFRSEWQSKHPKKFRRLLLYFSTSLRESFEEMHLNPLLVDFLGPLPPVNLRLARQNVYPMVGWLKFHPRLFPNREVEKIILIPLEKLLNPGNYYCYRLSIPAMIYANQSTLHTSQRKNSITDFPCYMHNQQGETEILWGATYRIIATFLEITFNFKPGNMDTLPVIHGKLDESYFLRQGD